MRIPINIPHLGNEEITSVISVLKANSLTTAAKNGGKNVQEIENLTSKFLNSKYTVAVNSGTSALQAALYSLDIGYGDEVLLPSFTFVATANAVMSTGAKPVFVDILQENFTIDPNDLRKKITKKSKAVIPVHLYGNVAYMKEILEICHKFNLKIVEDAAQSMGSTLKQKHTGTFGDLGCFSLYPAKVMTSGEGGLIITNKKKLYEKLLMIRNHGMIKGYDTKIFGLNLRMPEINASIAKIQIKRLPKFLEKRRKNAILLSELLSDLKIITPSERIDEKVNWYLFTIIVKRRNEILKKLNAKGIGAAAYYALPVHKTPLYNKQIKLPNTDWASKHVLSIPVHPNVSENNIHYISKILHKILN